MVWPLFVCIFSPLGGEPANLCLLSWSLQSSTEADDEEWFYQALENARKKAPRGAERGRYLTVDLTCWGLKEFS